MQNAGQGAGAVVPAGWYVDPAGFGQRYWDGRSWTGHVAPLAPQAPDEPVARMGDWVGGVLLSLIIPVVGLIAGIIYVARGGQRARCRWMCIALSLVVAGIWTAIALTSEPRTSTYYVPQEPHRVPPSVERTY